MKIIREINFAFLEKNTMEKDKNELEKMKNEEKDQNDIFFKGKTEEIMNKSDEIEKINQDDEQEL